MTSEVSTLRRRSELHAGLATMTAEEQLDATRREMSKIYTPRSGS